MDSYKERRGKVKRFEKKIASAIAVLFTFSLFSEYALVAEVKNTKSTTALEQKSSSGGKEIQSTTPIKKPITYGPYNGVEDQKHAYSPFKEKEEKQESKGLSFKKDRILIKLEKPGNTTSVFINAEKESKNLGILNLTPVISNNKTSSKTSSISKYQENLSKWHVAKIKEGADVTKLIE